MAIEEWRDVVGYEGLYKVNSSGVVKKEHKKGTERILKTRFDSSGYKVVTLWSKNKGTNTSVHRILAKVFIPNPKNKLQVNHINGIKSDNRLENLEWCTAQENIRHSFATGLSRNVQGERNVNSKLKEYDVKEIKLLLGIISMRRIALLYGVSIGIIQGIKDGTRWKNVL